MSFVKLLLESVAALDEFSSDDEDTRSKDMAIFTIRGRWALHQPSPEEDDPIPHSEVFRLACITGRLKFAKKLLVLNPNIDFSYMNHAAFRQSHFYGHWNIFEWLSKVRPFYYKSTEIEGTNNSLNITRMHYRVREAEDKRWQKRKYAIFMRADAKSKNVFYRISEDVSRFVIQEFL